MAVKFKSPKRISASKVWISDIIEAPYNPAVGFTPGYAEVNGKHISKINIVTTVVSKFISEDGNYGSITLDDGSETIRVKAFGPDVIKVSPSKVGDLVRFIGKIKRYNEETYLAPEAVHVITDPNWIIVHRLELGRPETAPEPEEAKPTISKEVAEERIKEDDVNVQAKVLAIIRKNDKGEGAEMQGVIAESGLDAEEAKNILIGLLKAGEIFEPRKEKLKVLD